MYYVTISLGVYRFLNTLYKLNIVTSDIPNFILTDMNGDVWLFNGSYFSISNYRVNMMKIPAV